MPEVLSLPFLTVAVPVLVTYLLTPYYIHVQKTKNVLAVNYQGTKVVTGGGLVLLAALAGIIFLNFFTLQGELFSGVMFLYLGGITLLGMYDDLRGEKGCKGFRGHFLKFWRKRKISTGLYKASGGLVLGTLVAALTGGGPWGEWLLKGIFLALLSNFFNLLDTRPARAAKFFFLFSFVFILIYKINVLPLFALWNALYIYLFWELKQKIMLGDAGAYLLGGALGFYLVTVSSPAVLLFFTIILVILHYLGEKFSFSRILENKVLLFNRGPARKGN